MAMQKTVAGGKGSQFPLYRVWDSMKYRCNNPRSTRWKYYGGRGIKVCEEWMASYEKFAEWATANGYAQGLEIDRRNNDGDYSPENCRWVTRQINTRNKRKPSKNGRTSKYLGVSRCGNRWRAQIGGDARGKSHIGLFKSEVDAAKAFDAEVVRRFGTGVATNFVISTTGDAMKSITCWEDLLEQAHPLAVEKGWWQDMDRPIDEQVANFHAEISEAWEEYRSNRMETWYSLGGKPFHKSGNREDGCPVFYDGRDDSRTPVKPEGFWVEIADLLIRLADTCGRYEWKPNWGGDSNDALNVPTLIAVLHCIVADMRGGPDTWAEDECCSECDHEEGTERMLVGATSVIKRFAERNSVDLWPIVNEKLAYNRTRPHRHGGKVA